MWKRNIVALGAGLLFGIGLTLSGMTQPQKVIGFLDITGNWDPTLALVMMGAIGVHLFAYLAVKKRQSPILAPSFLIPINTTIDKKLIIGSVLFGAGWGLGGYCPGPAVTSIVSLQAEVFVFLAAIMVGMLAHHKFEQVQQQK